MRDLMLLGSYSISDHARDQYKTRCRSKRRSTIGECIRYDLRNMNITNIYYGKYTVHVFTRGYKEFIFLKKNKRLVLKTFIQNTATTNKYQKDLRKRQTLVK